MNPGNVGVSLVNIINKIVVVNSFILSRSGEKEGICLYLKINITQDFIKKLRN